MSVSTDNLLDHSSRPSVATSSSSSSSSSSSLSCAGLTSSEVDLLTKLGFLTARRLSDSVSAGHAYWVAHPRLGRLVAAVTGARAGLVALLRSRKHKEIAEEELYNILATTAAPTPTVAVEVTQLLVAPQEKATAISSSLPSSSSSMSTSATSFASGLKPGKRKRSAGSWGGCNTPQATAARLACAGLGVRYCVLYLEGHSWLVRVKTPSDQWVLRLHDS